MKKYDWISIINNLNKYLLNNKFRYLLNIIKEISVYFKHYSKYLITVIPVLFPPK